MKILYVPEWMNENHWLLMLSLFTFLGTYCMGLFVQTWRPRAFAHGLVALSAAGVASMFWLIQSELTRVDPVLLFFVERILWYPMLVGMAALVDLYSAEMNGHKSLIARTLEWYEKRQKEREGAVG